MTIDLPSFWLRHEPRLRKHVPHRFGFIGGSFCLVHPGRTCDADVLFDDEASIFLEHAARRVLEEDEEGRLHRIKSHPGYVYEWIDSADLVTELGFCDSPLHAMSNLFDTLFPTEKPADAGTSSKEKP